MDRPTYNQQHNERLLKLLETGNRSDTILVVGKDKFKIKAHSQILIAASPIFEQLLNKAPLDEEYFRIEVSEFEHGDFIDILKYIYTGICTPNPMSCLSLERAGKKYLIPDLEVAGRKCLEEQLDENSIWKIFEEAREFGPLELEAVCLKFICRSISTLINCPEFVHLQEDNLRIILALDDLDIQEIELFKALLKWAEHKCQRTEMMWDDPANRRVVLDGMIHLIRFPVMDQSDFALYVATAQVLTMEELIAIIIYFSVSPEKRIEIPSGRFNSQPRRTTVNQVSGHSEVPAPPVNLVVVGSAASGKTTLLNRYFNDIFLEVNATVGMDFYKKQYKCRGIEKTLRAVDTMGCEGFMRLIRLILVGKDGVIITYDITKENELENAVTYIKLIKDENNRMPILLCGTKTDLTNARIVSREDASRLALKYGFLHIETSSKTGLNVNEAFDLIISASISTTVSGVTSEVNVNKMGGSSCSIV